MSDRWTQERCRKLIKLYGQNKCLYDVKHCDYSNKYAREKAWEQISKDMGAPTTDIKKKMDSLLGSYRRERSREKISRVNGPDGTRSYHSKWFAFDWLNKFLNKSKEDDDTNSIKDISDEQATSNDTNTYEIMESERVISQPRKRISFKPTRKSLKTGALILPRMPQLQKIPKSENCDEDEFDAFGRNVALQLKKLPLIHALESQELIQRILKEQRFAALQDQTAEMMQSASNTFTFEVVEAADPLANDLSSTKDVAKSEPAEWANSKF